MNEQDEVIDDAVGERVLAVLAEVRALHTEWWLDGDKVRARGTNLDPLCELYRTKLRRPIRLHEFEKAGRELGLSDSETLDVVAACDGHPYPVPEQLRTLVRSLIK